jgi:hypothetical protein
VRCQNDVLLGSFVAVGLRASRDDFRNYRVGRALKRALVGHKKRAHVSGVVGDADVVAEGEVAVGGTGSLRARVIPIGRPTRPGP